MYYTYEKMRVFQGDVPALPLPLVEAIELKVPGVTFRSCYSNSKYIFVEDSLYNRWGIGCIVMKERLLEHKYVAQYAFTLRVSWYSKKKSSFTYPTFVDINRVRAIQGREDLDLYLALLNL